MDNHDELYKPHIWDGLEGLEVQATLPHVDKPDDLVDGRFTLPETCSLSLKPCYKNTLIKKHKIMITIGEFNRWSFALVPVSKCPISSVVIEFK